MVIALSLGDVMIQPRDYAYADEQRRLRAGKRKTTSTKTDLYHQEKVETTCVRCGERIVRSRGAIYDASRLGRGGCCCKTCKYKKAK